MPSFFPPVDTGNTAHLKESFQPPYLENAFPNQNRKLEDAPPLHAAVGALSGISVHSLAEHDISLLVLHLCESIGKFADYISK